MPSARDLKRRIRSVKGTQQITKAMKMVAAAKLRRAQERITAARPYADTLARTLASVAERTEHTHPLLAGGEREGGGRTWLFVVTSDKGLAGSFNAALLREAEKLLRSDRWERVEVLAVGRKAADHFRRREHPVAHSDSTTMSDLAPEDGGRFAEMAIEAFTEDGVDEVWVLYNRFESLISQTVTLERLLPVEPEAAAEAAEGADDGPGIDYLYEPGPAELLAALLPAYVATQLQRVLYDSAAAEQAARMTAMDSATKNASEMIEHLTLLYNRTRQAAITTELIEIVSGAQALNE